MRAKLLCIDAAITFAGISYTIDYRHPVLAIVTAGVAIAFVVGAVTK